MNCWFSLAVSIKLYSKIQNVTVHYFTRNWTNEMKHSTIFKFRELHLHVLHECSCSSLCIHTVMCPHKFMWARGVPSLSTLTLDCHHSLTIASEKHTPKRVKQGGDSQWRRKKKREKEEVSEGPKRRRLSGFLFVCLGGGANLACHPVGAVLPKSQWRWDRVHNFVHLLIVDPTTGKNIRVFSFGSVWPHWQT